MSRSKNSIVNTQFADIQAAASKLIAQNVANTLRPTDTFGWAEPATITNEDRAASIENIIADFLPDSHKDIPVEIAKAVVEALFPTMEESNTAPSPQFNKVKVTEYNTIVSPSTYEDLKRYAWSQYTTTTTTATDAYTFGGTQ